MAKHPATFHDNVLQTLQASIRPGSLVLDPFGGTGKLFRAEGQFRVVCVELEWEWATMRGGPDIPGWRVNWEWTAPKAQVQGNILHLPFQANTFDYIATSPCFGNRMADSHNAKDPSERRSYRHDLGRKLQNDNAGWMQWTNPRYRTFHLSAWAEAIRVLKPGCGFLLDIKDHYRTVNGQKVLQPVKGWHIAALKGLGLQLLAETPVLVPGNRRGENRHRAEDEYVVRFHKPFEPTAFDLGRVYQKYKTAT